MILKNKRIAVLGGAGFIGSHLIDRLLLDEPEAIIAIDDLSLGKRENLPDGIKLCELNAACRTDLYDVLTTNDIDIVFNLAVKPLPESIDYPVSVWDTNVEIVKNLVELSMQDVFAHGVFFSSSEVYGTCLDAPMAEDHLMLPLTPYAASKAACDMLVQSYVNTYGINAMIVRPFNVYGPRQNSGSYAGVIPLTIQRLMDGKKAIINGTGQQTRDYTYVTDICEGAVKAVGWKSGVVNLCSGKQVTIDYLVKTIIVELGITHQVMYIPSSHWNRTISIGPYSQYTFSNYIEYHQERPADVMSHIGDNTRARELLGWQPNITMEEGIRRTVDWYVRDHKERIPNTN